MSSRLVDSSCHMSHTLVSVIIPTRNRPQLVLRAVRSALNQTYPHLEVIVVVDGPDPATNEALNTVVDERLRVVAFDQSVGGSDARNKGVQHASGHWIAFLDDDDEWLAPKIEKQIDAALDSNSPFPVVTCYFIGRTPLGDFIGPRRTPKPREPLCEYLFSRRSFFPREGQLQTTLILTSRELMHKVPFTSGLRRHQDTDWYLRIATVAGVEIKFVREPLAIWYLDENKPRVTGCSDWRYSLEWLRGVRSIITARAYAGFIATQLAPEAARQGDWAAFFPLLREAVAEGRVLPIDLMLYLGNWLTPGSLRRKLRLALERVWPVRIDVPL
jgi:glycosyltransferase involved in cell wall biosynthesis